MSCSLRETILQYDRPVPRYTSYPTAPHFSVLKDAAEYHDWLDGIAEEEPLSLYLHVPFCPKMCWYCGCNTKITKRDAPVERYAGLLRREIDILTGHFPEKRAVSHIHFGGGSPGLLRACDFKELMDRMRLRFAVRRDAEIAMEIDPRGVTEGRAATYAACGVNRISLGVQDFSHEVLSSVNRPQPFHLSYDAVRLFRAYGIDRFNVDLLYGLPHQTLENMRQTIEKTLYLDPDRISVFGYAHVPWMKKHMRLIDESALPDKSLRFDLFHLASEILADAGYVAIGIDHFAKADDALALALKEGRLHRNFQGYTADASRTLIGIGASSIGKCAGGYVQNYADMPHYEAAVLAGRLPVHKICRVECEDKARAAIIESLMCSLQADIPSIAARFGLDPGVFRNAFAGLESYVRAGLVEAGTDMTVRIVPQARAATRLIAAAFDRYFTALPETGRHARAI